MQHSIGIITEYYTGDAKVPPTPERDVYTSEHRIPKTVGFKRKFEYVISFIVAGINNIPNLSYYFITESNKDEVIKRIKEKKLTYIVHMTESGIHKLVTEIQLKIKKLHRKMINQLNLLMKFLMKFLEISFQKKTL